MNAWEQAYGLLAFLPPCQAFDTIASAARHASDDAQADAWIKIGDCISRILLSECGMAH